MKIGSIIKTVAALAAANPKEAKAVLNFAKKLVKGKKGKPDVPTII